MITILLIFSLFAISKKKPAPPVLPGQSYISSDYGYRIHPVTGVKKFHTGVDLASGGTPQPVYSTAPGTVKTFPYSSTAGNYIAVVHKNYTSLYMHLSEVFVMPGQKVPAGYRIGTTGSTGASTGIHLHYEERTAQGKHRRPSFLYSYFQKNKKEEVFNEN